jgi:hypothetical protein
LSLSLSFRCSFLYIDAFSPNLRNGSECERKYDADLESAADRDRDRDRDDDDDDDDDDDVYIIIISGFSSVLTLRRFRYFCPGCTIRLGC